MPRITKCKCRNDIPTALRTEDLPVRCQHAKCPTPRIHPKKKMKEYSLIPKESHAHCLQQTGKHPSNPQGFCTLLNNIIYAISLKTLVQYSNARSVPVAALAALSNSPAGIFSEGLSLSAYETSRWNTMLLTESPSQSATNICWIQ